jgi:hypothetical protein
MVAIKAREPDESATNRSSGFPKTAFILDTLLKKEALEATHSSILLRAASRPVPAARMGKHGANERLRPFQLWSRAWQAFCRVEVISEMRDVHCALVETVSDSCDRADPGAETSSHDEGATRAKPWANMRSSKKLQQMTLDGCGLKGRESRVPQKIAEMQ